MNLAGAVTYCASWFWDALKRLRRERPSYLILAVALLVGAASARLLIELIEQLIFKEKLGTVDRWVFQALQTVRTESAAAFFTATTRLGDAWMLIAAALAGVAVLLVARRRLEAIAITATFALAAASVAVMKVALQRARPDTALHLVAADGPAFPSGHASLSVVVYVLLAYLVARPLKSVRWRYVVFGAAAMLSFAIGLSRLVLGVHWLSDVLAGYALAGMWVAIAIIAIEFMRYFRPAPILDANRRWLVGWTITSLVPLMVALAIYYTLR